MRPVSDDPVHLTPHQRQLEIAAILATGIHRLRHGLALDAPVGQQPPIRANGVADSHQIPPKSLPSGLEVCALTGPDGVTRQPERTREA